MTNPDRSSQNRDVLTKNNKEHRWLSPAMVTIVLAILFLQAACQADKSQAINPGADQAQPTAALEVLTCLNPLLENGEIPQQLSEFVWRSTDGSFEIQAVADRDIGPLVFTVTTVTTSESGAKTAKTDRSKPFSLTEDADSSSSEPGHQRNVVSLSTGFAGEQARLTVTGILRSGSADADNDDGAQTMFEWTIETSHVDSLQTSLVVGDGSQSAELVASVTKVLVGGTMGKTCDTTSESASSTFFP